MSTENLKILADSAFESENYNLAYDYYNRLLENEIDNPKYWINKAICAINISTIDKILDKEVIVSINTALKFNKFPEDKLEELTNIISQITYDKIFEGNKFIINKINREFNTTSFPVGTWDSVRSLARKNIELKVWNEYRKNMFQYFNLMNFIVRLKPNLINCDKGLSSITYIYNNAKDNFYQINGDTSESKLLKELQQFCKDELDKISPNHKPSVQTSDSSGCFIATATMGSYNHPIVYELRLFRDECLLKNKYGKSFTKWYYNNSPKVADFIKNSDFLKYLTFISIVLPLFLVSKIFRK